MFYTNMLLWFFHVSTIVHLAKNLEIKVLMEKKMYFWKKISWNISLKNSQAFHYLQEIFSRIIIFQENIQF